MLARVVKGQVCTACGLSRNRINRQIEKPNRAQGRCVCVCVCAFVRLFISTKGSVTWDIKS